MTKQIKNRHPKKRKASPTIKISARTGVFVLIFVAVVMMGLKVQDIVGAIATGQAPAAVPPAQAETKAAPEEPAKKTEEAKPEEKKPDEKKPEADAPPPEGDQGAAGEPEDVETYSEAEVNILKRLSERRQELEKRARELDQKEALMRLTEQRVDKKMSDLKAAQEQLRAAIGAAAGEQKKRADLLVKIYETMKPKEAARIFETLDIPTVVAVVSNMKEARVAPIMAAMEPTKARAITGALMEKKPLPSVPE